MKFSETLLPEFDHEMANTRKTLERVPDDKFDWKPHEKSTAMGGLATHLANLLMLAVQVIKTESFDAGQNRPAPATSTAEVLERFDKAKADVRNAITEASNEELLQPWSLVNNGRTVLTLPRTAALRSFIMNHMIHHRAQLSVYLRLNNIPVPALYGPSADEGMS